MSYETIKQLGITNIFDIKTVKQLTGLEKNEIFTIMKNYSDLKLTYLKNDKLSS